MGVPVERQIFIVGKNANKYRSLAGKLTEALRRKPRSSLILPEGMELPEVKYTKPAMLTPEEFLERSRKLSADSYAFAALMWHDEDAIHTLRQLETSPDKPQVPVCLIQREGKFAFRDFKEGMEAGAFDSSVKFDSTQWVALAAFAAEEQRRILASQGIEVDLYQASMLVTPRVLLYGPKTTDIIRRLGSKGSIVHGTSGLDIDEMVSLWYPNLVYFRMSPNDEESTERLHDELHRLTRIIGKVSHGRQPARLLIEAPEGYRARVRDVFLKGRAGDYVEPLPEQTSTSKVIVGLEHLWRVLQNENQVRLRSEMPVTNTKQPVKACMSVDLSPSYGDRHLESLVRYFTGTDQHGAPRTTRLTLIIADDLDAHNQAVFKYKLPRAAAGNEAERQAVFQTLLKKVRKKGGSTRHDLLELLQEYFPGEITPRDRIKVWGEISHAEKYKEIMESFRTYINENPGSDLHRRILDITQQNLSDTDKFRELKDSWARAVANYVQSNYGHREADVDNLLNDVRELIDQNETEEFRYFVEKAVREAYHIDVLHEDMNAQDLVDEFRNFRTDIEELSNCTLGKVVAHIYLATKGHNYKAGLRQREEPYDKLIAHVQNDPELSEALGITEIPKVSFIYM